MYNVAGVAIAMSSFPMIQMRLFISSLIMMRWN